MKELKLIYDDGVNISFYDLDLDEHIIFAFKDTAMFVLGYNMYPFDYVWYSTDVFKRQTDIFNTPKNAVLYMKELGFEIKVFQKPTREILSV